MFLDCGSCSIYWRYNRFLGLVAPHIVRLIWGSDYRRLIPYSAIIGGSILMLADALGRVLIQPSEIPVGVMTSIMGGPFFVFLLKNNNQRVHNTLSTIPLTYESISFITSMI